MLNVRIVGTYPPRRCGIATCSRDLADALRHFGEEVGRRDVTAIDDRSGPYGSPVDLVIDQYNPKSWRQATKEAIARARRAPIPRSSYFSRNTAWTRIGADRTTRARTSWI